MKVTSVFRFLSFFIIVLLIFQFSISTTHAQAAKDEAALALATGQSSLVEAYQSSLKAEEAGANISSLVLKLNEAGELIVRAQMAYSSGNFDSALSFAAQSQEKLNGFVVQADVLKEKAIQDNSWDFMVNVVGSIFGSVAVACGSVVIWVFLSLLRKYRKTGA